MTFGTGLWIRFEIGMIQIQPIEIYPMTYVCSIYFVIYTFSMKMLLFIWYYFLMSKYYRKYFLPMLCFKSAIRLLKPDHKQLNVAGSATLHITTIIWQQLFQNALFGLAWPAGSADRSVGWTAGAGGDFRRQNNSSQRAG